MRISKLAMAAGVLTISFGISCTPTVKVETPDRPLEINMNVKIDHNIVVKVDKQLDKVMDNNDDIF